MSMSNCIDISVLARPRSVAAIKKRDARPAIFTTSLLLHLCPNFNIFCRLTRVGESCLAINGFDWHTPIIINVSCHHARHCPVRPKLFYTLIVPVAPVPLTGFIRAVQPAEVGCCSRFLISQWGADNTYLLTYIYYHCSQYFVWKSGNCLLAYSDIAWHAVFGEWIVYCDTDTVHNIV